MADVTIDGRTAAQRARDHDTGLPSTKLAMWLFLASECLLFGALITHLRAVPGRAATSGPYPADVFDIPLHVGVVVRAARLAR